MMPDVQPGGHDTQPHAHPFILAAVVPMAVFGASLAPQAWRSRLLAT
jgi:hypothetical protein